MAKGRKKSKGNGNGQAGTAAAGAVVADLVNNIAGQAIGQLLADGVQRKAPSLFGGPDKGPDTAAKILMVLAEHGPRSVAELLVLTDAPVQTLLDAIAAARRAKLIERIDKAGRVRATDPGCQVAAMVRQKLEQQGEASAEESTAKGDGA